MPQTVVLKVSMACQGCAGSVRRVLAHIQGVESVDVNLQEQKVTVTGDVQPQAVLEALSKSGKTVSFWDLANHSLYAANGDL